MKDALRYFAEVLKHKWYVLLYGLKVGGIPLWRLVIHDWSKFLPTECRAYIKKRVLHDCPRGEWRAAWFHHVRFNPHHWEHWLFEGEPQPMPEHFVREMVADWMAAGKAYAKSADIQTWMSQNALKMILHRETGRVLEHVLAENGLNWPLAGDCWYPVS